MANGTITVAVDAETSKAKSKIQALQKEVQGSQSLKSLGGGLKGLGLDGMGGQLAGLGDALGSLSKFAGPAAAVGGVAVIAKGLSDMAERGQEAATAAEKMNTSLTTLSRNFGGTGAGVKEVTRELQLMAANGVASLDDINDAMKTLTVAYSGNVVKAGEMVKGLDNIAAGTGTSIAQWATLTAKINENGIETRDLNRLARQGIPIWDAFASAMGTTADEAKQMAKEGKLGVDNWNKAVQELSKNYAGLSAAMSSQTIEGAQGTYQAMRSMQMQATAEGRNSVLIDALNENSAKIQAQLDDPVRTEQLRATGELAGQMDWLGQKIMEAVSDLPGMIAQGLVNLEATIQDLAYFLNIGKSSNDVGARRYMANVLGKDLAGQQEFLQGDHTAADWAGKIKENEATIKRIETLIANGELEAETAKYLEANIENYKQINAILQENLRYAESNERTASEIKQREEEQQAQVQAILDRSASMQKEFRQMDVREATASGDPRKLMEVYFGPLMADLETYFAGIPALRDKLQAGLGSDEEMEIYKMLIQAQEMHNKQLEEEGKLKEKQSADLEKMKQEYKDGIIRDIANTQSELQSVNAKIEEQQMAAQEIADEEAHGIFRQKWGNLDVSTVKSESAELLKKQAELNDKLAGLDEKWRNSDQHIEDSIKAVNKFTNDLANRVISINAVVDPIRVG